ncbi:peroxidase 4-like [Euphorbia lathyris]|uniref:peroxidase 4-like n=1 Tax=Euphorbia lathyris TaxID=212925 RepID=UPI0033139183
MASGYSDSWMGLTLMIVMILSCEAQLSDENFYAESCPPALSIIKGAISTAVSRELRMAASLIRLHFHDCFVRGCDASLLLNEPGERDSIFNANSVRGFEVIENIKTQIERQCPQVVPCADILAVAARDASVAVAGPSWEVKLGRRDSNTAATQAEADTNLPGFNDNLAQLTDLFVNRKGFTQRDMVALSGAHTFGIARCFSFRDRANGIIGGDIDAGFARTVRENVPCPADGSGDQNLRALDSVTPDIWDNSYYRNLVDKRGLLESDQALYSGGSTNSIVDEYVRNPAIFMGDFSAAMVKMAALNPITDPNQGQIRNRCSAPN